MGQRKVNQRELLEYCILIWDMYGLSKWTKKRIIDLEEDNGLCKVIKGPWKETPIKQIDEIAIDLEIKKRLLKI